MVERENYDHDDQETKTTTSTYDNHDDHDDHVVEECVDWRGRPCNPNNHGGMKAAVFVLGLQAFEMMGIAGVGNNLITYVFNEMHFPLSKSANIVTNFVGTVFLLSLLGGFLSDSYFGSFFTMLIFAFVELSGFILLAVQAHVDELRPAPCKMLGGEQECEEAKGYKAVILFTALYLVALGSGCLKPNIISHGAHQFRSFIKHDNDHQSQHHTRTRKININNNNMQQRLSSYFNAAYFAFCTGELVALTLLVWIQTHSGMDVGFGVSAAAMAVGLLCLISGTTLYATSQPRARGSIFTPIAQVFVAAFSKRKQICPSNAEMSRGSQTSTVQNHLYDTSTNVTANLLHTNKFRFLDKACIKVEDESPWRVCSVGQVEQVKIILSVIPIFACTIIFNTVLAQLQTFSVQQGSSMNTHLFSHSFRIPPASLQAIPYILLIFLVPLYELAFVPASQKLTGGISPLQRIGIGLFIATFSMVCAALVEAKRRQHSSNMSILWIAPQFLIFGLSEMFTAVGLIEFFYMESLELGMQSFLTAMTYCSYSFGFYLSSVLVCLVNKVTSTSRSAGWLGYNDLNQDRLDLFYWLLAALSLINFFNYIFWAKWYSYNPIIFNNTNVNVSSQSIVSPTTSNSNINSDIMANNVDITTSTITTPPKPSSATYTTAAADGQHGRQQLFQNHYYKHIYLC